MIGHDRDLGLHQARGAEGVLDDPATAGVTEAGKVKSAATQAFGDVAGIADADEEKRHTPGAGALHGGLTVANLLKTGAKSAAQQVTPATRLF